MRSGVLGIVSCLTLVMVCTPDVTAQRDALNPAFPQPARPWSAPRTPDGVPDLQGVWMNNTEPMHLTWRTQDWISARAQ